MSTSQIILKSLVVDYEFARRVFPYLREEYFEDSSEQLLFKFTSNFIKTYGESPTFDALFIELTNDKTISESHSKGIDTLVGKLKGLEDVKNLTWLTETTERFCQERALVNALRDSISVYEGEVKGKDWGAIPDILTKALGVSFNSNIGHDYIEDAEERFNYYHRKEEKIPCDLKILNTVMDGGAPKKTLNLWLAGCVDENTLVKIRFAKQRSNRRQYQETKILDIKQLLIDFKVEILGPDGYQSVTAFVDKGIQLGYKCTNLETKAEVIVNENHLFETDTGWQQTKNLVTANILMEDEKYSQCKIEKLTTKHYIVDIQVDHPNHRYFANGFSSHNTHVGKSALMCHQAASYLSLGHNVLYITFEMSDKEISKRIDANLFDVTMDDLKMIPKNIFMNKVSQIKEKTRGRLKVKEYPTAGANVSHIRAHLNELKLKKGFIPDVLIIDYLNIMSSTRYRLASENSYAYVKAIAEEVRGLAQEYDVPIWSASQFNRSSAGSSNPDFSGIAESFGVAFTVDFSAALVATEELIGQGLMMVKQLKNRYSDMNLCPKFFIGFDRTHMRFYSVDNPTRGISVEPTTPKILAPKTSSLEFDDFKF